MYTNFLERENGARFEADVCIMGAGAAGITMARELAGSELQVLLVESGDFEADQDTIALNDGKIIGEPYPPLEMIRLRFFGGTTNHWGGHCRPLDAIDFEKREWVPNSGWPITRDDLEPYYRRAQEICELGPYEYDPAVWVLGLHELIAADPARWATRVWHYSPPTRFGQKYRDDLGKASNVTVLLNANVVDIELNESASAVETFRLKALDGREATVKARVFVLAGGGIENPRLMLASNKVMKAGVGNGHDLVGRYFMDHPEPLLGYAIPAYDFAQFGAYFHGVPGRVAAGEAKIRMMLGPTEGVQRERRMRNGTVAMGYGDSRAEGFLAYKEAREDLSLGEYGQLGNALVGMVKDLDGLAEGLYHRWRNQMVIWFLANIETEPNPNSRVTLDTERDALGSPKPVLDWRVTQGDKDDLRTMMRTLGEELSRIGFARVHIDDWLMDSSPTWKDISLQYHNIGTTRMSHTPKTGVVDADCKVFGLANLYVAGSSVFATEGYANPTMTIVALAVRLAEHLKAVAAHAS